MTYLRAADGSRRATGLLVLTLDDGRVAALTRFDEAVLGGFAPG